MVHSHVGLGWTVVVGFFFFQTLQLFSNDILAEAEYAGRTRASPYINPGILTYVWFGMGAAGLIATELSSTIIQNSGPKVAYLNGFFPALAAMMPAVLGYMEEKKSSGAQLANVRKCFYEQKEACLLGVTIFLLDHFNYKRCR